MCEEALGEGADSGVDVEVFEGGELPVLGGDEVGVGPEGAAGAVFVAVDGDVGVEEDVERLDGAGLLSHEFDVVTVRVEAGGEEALEVGYTVRVVAWDDEEVRGGEDFGCVGLVVVESAEEGEDCLIARWFVAVHAAVDVDTELVGSVRVVSEALGAIE